ncbi:APC family permease [Noviherbaspirillum autotrophicum]|uniref:Amino acid transporter n=1 Tax=Noviherbaspirillum autotrophicum TaxID=709839 RepID=A0A0C2BKA6_9BURK|nr:APC family permease [Noviherbaspirillum autotrophicum]KIF80399.1 amino acid transporter [Noviherbaspirillum autotrophicum]
MKPAKIREIVLGKALDPLKSETRHSLALVAFLAWVGLGADGLSSSAYGPEEAFKALGTHGHFGVYLALATAITVFIISLAYNQVIELFPTGGGGYRIATTLIGPYAGLVSGAALIVDYVLTISISVASCVDALFSLLPLGAQAYKLMVEVAFVLFLLLINLRGAKESIKILLPIFLGFVVSHAILIVYGLVAHASGLPELIPDTIDETRKLASETSWVFTIALLLKAYSLGGGTYTGIEAVSNNVNSLAEPRVRTGKLTMLYMAFSLAFTAAGIILLYLLWNAVPVEGRTLNAVVFNSILANMGFSGASLGFALTAVLAFEAGLLLVAANAGFLGGPAVLSNMAADSWVPHKFRYLSTRLVTQNGILVMGVAALAVLFWTGGKVDLLVVLYSINVFLTFSLSLAGLCLYWIKHRNDGLPWRSRLLLSALGLVVTCSILAVTVVEKFFEGGWMTVLITTIVIGLCLYIRSHYRETKEKIGAVDQVFANQPFGSHVGPVEPNPENQTAVFIVGSSRGGGLHALLWVQRMFPGHFKNFIFVNARTVDSHAYGGEGAVEQMRAEANATLKFFVDFCHSHGMASAAYLGFGTDVVVEVTKLCEKISEEYPNSIFFTSKLIFEDDNWFTRMLHNQAALAIQRRLHFESLQMVILPMKV